MSLQCPSWHLVILPKTDPPLLLFISPAVCNFLWRLLNNPLYLGLWGTLVLSLASASTLATLSTQLSTPLSLPTSLSLLPPIHTPIASNIVPWPSLFGPKLKPLAFFMIWAFSSPSPTGTPSSDVHLTVTSLAVPPWQQLPLALSSYTPSTL